MVRDPHETPGSKEMGLLSRRPCLKKKKVIINIFEYDEKGRKSP